MKILLIGNGINLTMSDSSEKYDILTKFIPFFLKEIGYIKIENSKNNFLFEEYLEWIGKPKRTKEGRKLFNFYSKISDTLYNKYDLELLVQIYITSLKFSNLGNARKKDFKDWINKLKLKIKDKIPPMERWDIGHKINAEYDLVITTNYDLNLENSNVKNVYYAHGNINDIENIELATFKKYEEIFEKIKSKTNPSFNDITSYINLSSNGITLDIFGISLYNEIHILKVLFKLREEYKEKFKITHYIYSHSDEDYKSQDISNLFLNYFYDIGWDDISTIVDEHIKNSNFEQHYNETYQSQNKDDKRISLNNNAINEILIKNEKTANIDDIEIFRFIFEFCKSIKIFNHTEHFLSKIDDEFISPTIEIDKKKIRKLW